MDATPPLIDALDRVAEQHCVARGYLVESRRLESDGYRRMTVRVNGGGEAVRVTYDGEVFSLSFPGGYGWTEFAYNDVDREEALMDLLCFLDAYADPDTHEVLVRRRLRRDRSELRVSNGAILRTRGWSSGPPS